MGTMLPPWQFSMDLAVLEFQKFRDSLLNVRFLVHFLAYFRMRRIRENPETLGIPTFRGFLFPCERGELNPHEHTLTAT